ncbi:hypothetical protein GE09DRAFT_1224625 [Coniochaeta sp. 2T2.1]|nr:hypothetical protein GE09DRAFT_1224625 [Coniochaeta sp. 2T2.1]
MPAWLRAPLYPVPRAIGIRGSPSGFSPGAIPISHTKLTYATSVSYKNHILQPSAQQYRPTMSSPEATGLGPPQVYDPDDDLRLVIGSEDPLSLIVCSKTLARASKFFKCLLYRGFKESKPADSNPE